MDVKTASLGKCCAEDGDPKICLTGILRALTVSVAVAAPPSNDGGVHPNFLPPRRFESDSSLLSFKNIENSISRCRPFICSIMLLEMSAPSSMPLKKLATR